MIIKEEILHSVGASIKDYKPSESRFTEVSHPNYYHHLIRGKVKLSTVYETTDG
ncbi:hypothetical protein [Chryseobacterium mucoviscidosis]|uniref:hypothetical protein n=1 Tax=Chryseobacterium mucoviscidosis TaxID=1945581 RepID=UPI0013FD3833|nr:hypothetical protein [Chryseobacterium mucoviscidosis]